MADISLLFDVAGGGSLSGESGKRIQEQLTAIVDKINSDPLKIKIVADDKSIEDLRKKIDELKKAVGSDGIIKIESSDLNGMAKTLNQISTALQHMMIAVGKNGAQLGKFSDQLQNIFEAIPENSNLTTKQIKSITDSFAELVDKVEELNTTVDQINSKKLGATINIAGGVQESAEQIEAYRKYLLALLRDFAELQSSYRHLMGESNNPKMANMAYAASAAVNGNRKLYDAIQNFNFGDMKAQAGLMDFEQLKEAVGLYKSLIASMINIRYKGNEIFSAGDQTAVNAALQQIREVESSMDNLGEAPAGGAGEGGSIFDFIDKVREGIEALQDPLSAVRKVIDETFTFGEIPEDRRTAMVESVTALSNEVSQVFTDLRVKITETFDFSSLSEDGRKEYIESIRSECLQIESFFDQLREKILATFDLSEIEIDTSNITGVIDQIQTAFGNLTIDLGKVKTTGTLGEAGGTNLNLVKETRQLRELIPNAVRISDSVSSETLDAISSAMQSMKMAEGDAASLTNLFKNLSGTVTEVTTKIVDQGLETERLKNVTIKGVDETGQAFTRSADYIVRHSKEEGDYIEGHTTTIRKQVIAQQEQTRATKEQAKAEDAAEKEAREAAEASAKRAEEEAKRLERRNKLLGESFALLTQIRRLATNEKTPTDQADRLKAMDSAITESQNGLRGGTVSNDSFSSSLADARTQLQEIRAELANVQKQEKETADDGSESLERRNKLLSESYTLLTQIRTMASRGVLTEDQSNELNSMDASITSYQESVRNGSMSNKEFADSIGKVRDRIKELRAETAGSSSPAKILTADSAEYADALKNIQTSIGNAQNALTNFSAAERSSNESSRAAYQNIGTQIQKLRELEVALRTGSMTEKDFKVRLSDINTEIKENSNVIRENGDAHKSLGEGIAKTIKNFSQWLGVSRILMGAIRTIKQMVSAVIELDTAMTELRKVTDETEERYDKFLEDAGVRAKQVGASLRDTVSATADFARLGYSVDQAEKLADAAIIYKNVGDGISDITEASESIISTMQAFAIKPEDVMSIVDKFNEVGNNFAISSGGVGEALLRSAAAMQAANNTLDETIALATAANKIVQNPQIVGTTLKTVSMFLRAAKTEAQEAGEETDGMADSVSKLRGEILALTGNKVDIQIDENTFKSTYQILKELSEVWGELTDVTQANILERIGGKRNANVVSALLNNFTTAEEALEVSVNSLNSAVEENEKVLASIQGRINLFKSSFEVLSQTVVNGDLVKVAIDSGTWILNTITSITKLIDSLGGLKTVLLAVGAAISFIPGVSSKLATVLTGLFKLIVSLDTVGFGGLKAGLLSIIKIIPTAITMWRAYSHGIVTAQAAMQATMPVIGLLVTAITGVVAVISKVKQAEADRRSAAIEAGRQAKTESEEILELLSSYEDLNEKIKTDESVKKDLESATDAIIKKLGLEKDAVEQLGASYDETTKKIRQKAVNQLAEQQRDLTDAYTSAGKDLVDTQRTGLTYGRTTNANMAEVWETALNKADREVIKRLEDLGLISGTRRGSQSVLGAGHVNTLQLIGSDNLSTAEGVYDAYERLGKILDILNTSTGTSQALYDAIYKEYDNLRNAADSYNSSLTGLNDNLAAQQFILSEIMGKGLPNTVEEFEQYRKAMVDGAQSARVFGGNITDIEEAVDRLLRNDSRFKQFFDGTTEASVAAENLEKLTSQRNALSDRAAALNEYIQAYDNLVDIEREAAEEGYTDTAETVFGNIDTNNRQILEWTQENLDKYYDVLKGWGYKEHEIRKMLGESSTVLGMSGEYEGLNIAFSPMLQTENGPVLLSADTVDRYIFGLIEELSRSGRDWYDEDLFRLDAEGLEIDGIRVKNLLASIGDDAERVGMVMHYAGKDGALADAMSGLKEAADNAGISLDGYRESIKGFRGEAREGAAEIAVLDRQIAEAGKSGASGYAEPMTQAERDFADFKKQIGDLGRALDEFNETGSISSDTYNKLVTGNEKYKDLFKFTGEGIELQTDKLNTYIETLGQEYGAKMAMAGATREDIQLMNALGETLVTVAEDNSNVAAEIEELSGTLKEMNAGNKLTSSQMSALVKKYPKLEGAVKDLGDGYTIEADAIRELIELKAQYLSLTDRETEVLKARNALNLSNNGNTAAVTKIDEIFKKYEELNGKAISSIEEFKQGYAEVFGEAYTGGYEAYERYVEALIAQNQDLVLSESFVEDALNATNDALEDTAKSMSDVQSELDNLSTVLGELNEGREYGTSEMITLLSKYPSLRNHIIKTANGYKIETSAIRELIAAKVQLISTQDSEMRIQQARTALTTATKDTNADKADAVFADYLAKNGRNIESLDEYKAAYKAYYGYAAKASQAYAQAKIDAFAAVSADDVMIDLFNDYINGPFEGYDPSKEEKSSSSAEEKVETEFEKAYKLHQHYLAMDQETEEQYLSWLEGAYKASYAAGEMELDDYYKYEEEVYEKRKELFSQSLDEIQHQIDLLSNQMGDTSEEQIALYEQMQKKVNQQANAYRAAGIKENDELIRELQNQWWQYEENIRQLRESAFSDWLNDRKFFIDQIKNGNLDKEAAGNPASIAGLRKERDAIAERTDALNKYIDAYGYLVEIENEAREAGYTNTNETVFGNINTNNRQILEWTQENINRYRNILSSWGYAEEDLQEMLGSYATVMGTSMNFDGLEIAFSPILQTEHGPELLSSDTVERYISELLMELSRSGKSWYDEDLLRLDTRGLEIDGMTVRNLLAAIGDDAVRVGEVMHFAGSDGALADAMSMLKDAAKKSGVSLDNFRENISEVKEEAESGRDQVRSLTAQIEAVGIASEEAASSISISRAKADKVIESWKEVVEKINDEITYYLSKGYDTTSDIIQNLMNELQSAKDAITEALDEVVSEANEVVDGFQNVYTTLTNAAKEYASTGYLSVDSLQSILELGPKYMDMLYDESGQLTINEEALQKVIAARTEEMAAETALSYAKQVLLATEGNESQKLKELTDVQAASSSATWDMAYATLGYAKALGATKGISDEYYEKAIQYVTRMQSVTKTATDSISAYYKTLDEGYVSQADGLETILKLTEDMLKQENSDRIKQLEDEKDAYKDIIDQKKEILRLTKEQQDHDRDMADKLKEISDLQSKIDQLALDDSREARAQRSKLEEQLLEKQKALTDSQNDYAIDAQEEALDKQYEEYEKGLYKQTDALKEELNSAEKLYQAAIDRISNGWDTLYDDLLNWNYNYGSTLQKDLVNAWEAAKTAAERYGDFVSAMEGVKEHDKLGEASYTPSTESVRNAVASGASTLTNYIDRMRANSLAWFTAEDQGYYEQDNRNAAAEYKAATGNTLSYKNGSWYQNGSSSPIYTLSRDEVGNAVVAAMRANSAAWKNASGSEQKDLERMNEKLAKRLSDFLGVPITKTPGGVWMLGTTPLYEVTKFHTGGIVGGRGSLRQNEVMALLKKGETVLDEKREQALYKTVDFVQVLSDKIGRAIDKGKISSLLSGTSQTVTKNLVPALAGGGIGTMNFSPTISVTIAGAGDLNESTARKYGTIAANTALEQLKSAFTQRGVSAAGNSILK